MTGYLSGARLRRASKRNWSTREPDRFFKPPMSAKGTFAGWLGVFIDTSGEHAVDWDEITAILEDAFRAVAPKALIAHLDKH